MSLRVVVRSPAETDVLESALFIAEDNPVAAQRFLDEAEKAFARLAEFPGLSVKPPNSGCEGWFRKAPTRRGVAPRRSGPGRDGRRAKATTEPRGRSSYFGNSRANVGSSDSAALSSACRRMWLVTERGPTTCSACSTRKPPHCGSDKGAPNPARRTQ